MKCPSRLSPFIDPENARLVFRLGAQIGDLLKEWPADHLDRAVDMLDQFRRQLRDRIARETPDSDD